MPQRIKRPPKKDEPGIDYMPEVDPYEDMDVEGLINFGDYVPPQQEKQIVRRPPTYEEALKDILEGKKEIYVEPQYFPQEPEELQHEHDDDEEINDELHDRDTINEILDDVGVMNYENVDKILNQPKMTIEKRKNYLNKTIKKAETERKKIGGYKSKITKDYYNETISADDRQIMNKRLDNARYVLNEYIAYHKTKLETIKGSGIKGRRRKQRGGHVMFVNDVKQLLNKLELIIGEVIAGNTSIQMRNTGVDILDTLLKMATINRPQYNKLYNQYFQV